MKFISALTLLLIAAPSAAEDSSSYSAEGWYWGLSTGVALLETNDSQEREIDNFEAQNLTAIGIPYSTRIFFYWDLNDRNLIGVTSGGASYFGIADGAQLNNGVWGVTVAIKHAISGNIYGQGWHLRGALGPGLTYSTDNILSIRNTHWGALARIAAGYRWEVKGPHLILADFEYARVFSSESAGYFAVMVGVLF